MRTRDDMIELAEQLFDCLPCASLDLPGEMGLERDDVAALLRFIRTRHLGEDGTPIIPFTVAPGKRGNRGSWYFPILLEKDGSYYFDRSNFDHLEDGVIGTYGETATKLLHAADAAEAFAAGIRPGAAKWYWEDIARRARREAEDIHHARKRAVQARNERKAS